MTDPAVPPLAPESPAAGPGIAEHTFTTTRAASEVRMHVEPGDQWYRCRATAPAGPLMRALQYQQAGDNVGLALVVDDLIRAVMFDEDRDRYLARTNATDLRPHAFDENRRSLGPLANVIEDRVRAEHGPGPNAADNPDGAAAHADAVEGHVRQAIAGIEDLDPIDPFAMIEHGLWLVGVYLNRPTEGPAPSGDGSVPTPTNSTPGALPTA